MQNTLELFWFTIDSSGLPHEGVQFFFMTSVVFLFVLLTVQNYIKGL